MSYFAGTLLSIGGERLRVNATLARRRTFHSPSEPNRRSPQKGEYDPEEKHRSNHKTGRNYQNLQNAPGNVRPPVSQQTCDDQSGEREHAAHEAGRRGIGMDHVD